MKTLLKSVTLKVKNDKKINGALECKFQTRLFLIQITF